MTLWSYPRVGLSFNPWQKVLDDGVVIQQLLTATHELCQWGPKGGSQIDDSKSYAWVLFDPTNQHTRTPLDRVMAIVLFGDDAEKYIPNAFAKAEFRDRHLYTAVPLLLQQALFTFGSDDFAYAGSADYFGAISAGSGLSEKQDGEVAQQLMEGFLGRIHRQLSRWLEESRRSGKSQAWFNRANEVPQNYDQLSFARCYTNAS